MRDVGADVIGVDYRLPLDEASRRLGGTHPAAGQHRPRPARRPLAGARGARARRRRARPGRPGTWSTSATASRRTTDPAVLTRVVELVHRLPVTDAPARRRRRRRRRRGRASSPRATWRRGGCAPWCSRPATRRRRRRARATRGAGCALDAGRSRSRRAAARSPRSLEELGLADRASRAGRACAARGCTCRRRRAPAAAPGCWASRRARAPDVRRTLGLRGAPRASLDLVLPAAPASPTTTLAAWCAPGWARASSTGWCARSSAACTTPTPTTSRSTPSPPACPRRCGRAGLAGPRGRARCAPAPAGPRSPARRRAARARRRAGRGRRGRRRRSARAPGHRVRRAATAGLVVDGERHRDAHRASWCSPPRRGALDLLGGLDVGRALTPGAAVTLVTLVLRRPGARRAPRAARACSSRREATDVRRQGADPRDREVAVARRRGRPWRARGAAVLRPRGEADAPTPTSTTALRDAATLLGIPLRRELAGGHATVALDAGAARGRARRTAPGGRRTCERPSPRSRASRSAGRGWPATASPPSSPTPGPWRAPCAVTHDWLSSSFLTARRRRTCQNDPRHILRAHFLTTLSGPCHARRITCGFDIARPGGDTGAHAPARPHRYPGQRARPHPDGHVADALAALARTSRSRSCGSAPTATA